MARRRRPVVVKVEGGDELIAQLRALGIDVDAAVEEASMDAVRIWVDEANRLAPGPHVVAVVASASAGKATIDVGPDNEHWHYRFFELGVQPHEIRPRKKSGKKALSFDDIVVKSVSHPGMAARPFLRPVADSRSDEVAAAFGKYLAAIIERHRQS
jgi:hypothetical protein